jgi:hypothetical protein
MRRGRWTKVAKIGSYTLGVANLALLIFVQPTVLSFIFAVVLAPFTLALALKLTALLSCHAVSFVLGDRRERAELLVCAVGGLQPPAAGKKYREAMLAEISAAPPDLVPAIRTDLVKTAVRVVVAAWAQFGRRLWKRARQQKVFSAQRPA